MKLLRYGPVGAEKPGILDARGNLRDLSAHVPDIAGAVLTPEGLDKLRALNPESLPVVTGLRASVPAWLAPASSFASVSTTPTMLPSRTCRFRPNLCCS